MIYDRKAIENGLHKIFTNGRDHFRKISKIENRNVEHLVYYSECDYKGIPYRKSQSCLFSDFEMWAQKEYIKPDPETSKIIQTDKEQKEKIKTEFVKIKPGNIFTDGTRYRKVINPNTKDGVSYLWVNEKGKKIIFRNTKGGYCSKKQFKRWGNKI